MLFYLGPFVFQEGKTRGHSKDAEKPGYVGLNPAKNLQNARKCSLLARGGLKNCEKNQRQFHLPGHTAVQSVFDAPIPWVAGAHGI